MKKIEPRILKGFRDIFPSELIAREEIVSIIKRVYESYGFSPLATPALEYKDILVGYGEEANKQIYTFSDPDKNDVGLRYDLTSPLSRVIAQYRNLEIPFKRYQIQEVYRYDKPDKGRFREFLQFDIDTVGVASVIADAEIISAMYESIKALGISNFKIRVNNRKLLETLLRFAGIEPALSHPVFRVIDKLDRCGLDAVISELGRGRKDESGADIRGLELGEEQISRLKEFIMLPGASRKDALLSVSSLIGDCEGIEELREIGNYLDGIGIEEDKVVFDFVVARGLDYYTGPVYEAVLMDAPGYGSIMGGGRYDNLIGQFTDKDIPATGASIGIDRLISAMVELKLIKEKKNKIDVLVTVMVKNRLIEYCNLANRLRENGINTEVYLGEGGIGKQLKYADRKEIPVVLIIGEDEFRENMVSIKDLRVKEKMKEEIKDREGWLEARVGQRKVEMSGIVEELKNLIVD